MFSTNRKALRNEILLVLVLATSLLTPPTFAVNQGPAAGGTQITIEGIHFTQVSVGETFALGVTNKGTVFTWGDNSFGELGNGSDLAILASNPVQVLTSANTPLSDIVEVAAGASFALARTSTGAVYAWGANESGQLGINSIDNAVYASRVFGVDGIGFLTDATALEAKGASAYALRKTTGEVYAWGYNGYGQLGNNTIDDSLVPGFVLNLDASANLNSVTSLSAGTNSMYAIGSGGQLWSWGRNNKKQLGDISLVNRWLPVHTMYLGSSLTDLIAISAGDSFAIAMGADGKIYSWGNNTDGATGLGTYTGTSNVTNIPTLGAISAIKTSYLNTYALKSDGSFYSWGSNINFALGDAGTKRNSPKLVTPAGVTIASLFDGTNCMLGLDASGNVYGWGTNSSGLVGDATTIDRPTPVQGPNFLADQVLFDTTPGTDLTVTGTIWTVTSPAGTADALVSVTGEASLIAATSYVSTVSFDAGTFQYEAAPVIESPTPTPDPTTPEPESTPRSDPTTPAPEPTASDTPAATPSATPSPADTGAPIPSADPTTPAPEPTSTETTPAPEPSESDTATPEPTPSDSQTPPLELPAITPPEAPKDEIEIPDESIPDTQKPKSALTNTKVFAPVLAISPKVSKKPKVKQPITLTTGNWNGGNSTKTYQWFRCAKQVKLSAATLMKKAKCTAINGATSSTYTPIRKDKSKYLLSQVTATNSAGKSTIYTSSTTKVK